MLHGVAEERVGQLLVNGDRRVVCECGASGRQRLAEPKAVAQLAHVGLVQHRQPTPPVRHRELRRSLRHAMRRSLRVALHALYIFAICSSIENFLLSSINIFSILHNVKKPHTLATTTFHSILFVPL